MMKHANDNFMCDEWIKFVNNKELFNWALRKGWNDTINTLKHKQHDVRAIANFVWFFKFEKSFAENEIQEKRNKFEVVR